jgi:ribose transport system substrate-binding protein
MGNYRTRTSRQLLAGVGVASIALAALGGAASAQSPDPATDGKVIAFVPGVAGNAFYISMECGIRAEAAKYGFEINMQGPQQFDPSLQTPIMNGVIAQAPAGLLTAPTDALAMFGPISEAAKAGIKVALVDTTLEDTSPAITAIATDNRAGGAAAADALAALIGEKGKVMSIPFKAGATTSDERQQGFEEQIATYPDIEYVGPQYSDNDPAKAAAQVASTIAAHPDLAGIFATNDRSAEGAATGLRNADKVGTVKVVGFDAGDVQVQQLKDGLVQALIAQQPYQIGVEGVAAIAAALKGEDVEPAITTGTVTITADNLDDPEIQKSLYLMECPA